ncbi:hypothetical protein [Saliphagus sp. LR7]|uniref:hypothetical protein n=1 Tax=Saliphagus sp. LR7 TaxID=2282654 RepID=UPI000DF73D02|nr:hypothetical protein [Saliphagus sp. LR7]
MNHLLTATLAVRVPVNATGDLAEGAATVLARLDAVERVEETDVRGLQPGLNDTVVDLEVRLAVADDVAAARREIESGVGVVGVETVVCEEEPTEAEPPAQPPPGVG